MLLTACGGRKDIIETSSEVESISAVSDYSYEEPTETETETEIEVQDEYDNEYEEVGYDYLENLYDTYTPGDLCYLGEIYWGGWRFTWYSENALPGGGLDIPGRWSDGDFVRDVYGYICCASEDLPYGSVVDTPWGAACVYDCGCASGTIDIYTSW